MLRSLRRSAGILLDGEFWRSGNARLLREGVMRHHRAARIATPDRDQLIAAAQWLERAQDATRDGGVSGRYALAGGWTSSYPETTGYIVPTFLALAKVLGEPAYRDRAARCIDFLLGVQLADGAFPGAEIAENRTEPSPFNTAQILHGLVAWHRETGDEKSGQAARRAANWLISCQDADGAWRQHVYHNTPASYSAHASCWLAECAEHFGEQCYRQAAERHLDWVLSQVDPQTGFFEGMGFSREQQEDRIAVTHTIAYTIWGVLFSAELLGREDGVSAASRAAEAIAHRLELTRGLPGVLDHRWKPRAVFTCLTGNAQMALIWLHLYRRDGDARLLNAALRAIDDVKAAQSFDNPNPGLRGGIAGSDPVWGDYLRMAVPNWSAKFFIDALLAKREVLNGVEGRPRAQVTLRADLPRALPAPIKTNIAKPRVVLYTRLGVAKLGQMLESWDEYGFSPDTVIIEQTVDSPLIKRVQRRVREDGFGAIRERLQPRKMLARENPTGHGAPLFDTRAVCQKAGLRVIETGPLSHPESVETVRSLAPDIAVHAGAGILRAPLLAIPRLGTLNAHMGILPFYRGMNVAEWARFGGDAVGPSVHLVSPGIDEGDILCVREIDVSRATNVSELRHAVDQAQIDLLAEVLRYVLKTGELPPLYPQSRDQGQQFFRMHRELVETLDKELASEGNPIPPQISGTS
jgi:hypothetical protein